jgi:hypothetical protein
LARAGGVIPGSRYDVPRAPARRGRGSDR